MVGTMLGTLAPMGLLSAYNYALRRPDGWPVPVSEIRSTSLKIAALLVTGVCTMGFFLFRSVDLGLAHSDQIWLTVMAATTAGFLVQSAKRRFQMLEKPVQFARVDLTFGLTVSGASLLGVVTLGWNVGGLAAGLLAGAILGIVVSIKSIWPDLQGTVTKPALRAAFGFGFPLFVHTGAAILLQYADRFMLERMSSMDQLGLYTLAGQLGTAMLILTTATNQAYLPFIYRHFDNRPALIRRGQRYVAAFFTAAGVVGMLIAPFFIERFVDARFAESLFPAQLLIAGGIFHGFYYLMVGRLMLVKRTTTIAIASVLATLLNVGLNYYLIPRFHAEGAAWATLASEAVLFGMVWISSRRVLQNATSTFDTDSLEASD
jgi:O-antigen/teichoic acid export membrane protein